MFRWDAGVSPIEFLVGIRVKMLMLNIQSPMSWIIDDALSRQSLELREISPRRWSVCSLPPDFANHYDHPLDNLGLSLPLSVTPY